MKRRSIKFGVHGSCILGLGVRQSINWFGGGYEWPNGLRVRVPVVAEIFVSL